MTRARRVQAASFPSSRVRSFESSEQDVAVDPLLGDGLQDCVLVGSQRFGTERVGRVPGPVDGRSGFLAVQPGDPIEKVTDRRG